MPLFMAERTKTLIQSVAFWSLLLGILGGVVKTAFSVGGLNAKFEQSIKAREEDSKLIIELQREFHSHDVRISRLEERAGKPQRQATDW